MKEYFDLGTFDEIFGAVSSDVSTIVQEQHRYILALDQDVHIVYRAGEKTAAYGIGPKKMSEAYCYIMPQKDYLNLGFFHGTSLPDPDALLEGTGNKLRHIKIRSIEQAKYQSIRNLIIAAKNERLKALKK
jgi:Domain of unknown function (DU1801)